MLSDTVNRLPTVWSDRETLLRFHHHPPSVPPSMPLHPPLYSEFHSRSSGWEWMQRVSSSAWTSDTILFFFSSFPTILENESRDLFRFVDRFWNPDGCNGFVNWRIRDGWGGEDRYGFPNRVSTFSRSQENSKNVKQWVLSVSIYERRFIEIEWLSGEGKRKRNNYFHGEMRYLTI